MTTAEQYVYAATFAHALQTATEGSREMKAAVAARAAAEAVSALRMASTYLDPSNYDDKIAGWVLREYRGD